MTDQALDISKEDFRLLIEGRLGSDEIKKLVNITSKSEKRFKLYIEILQEMVSFTEKILLRLGDNLYIVRKKEGERVVKCSCGQEYGDYRINWKFGCLVRVRKTSEEFSQVYTIPKELLALRENLVEIREYYCPNCLVCHSVEIVPPGYPPIFEFLPDLDGFYREWLGEPLEDEDGGWFQDMSSSKLTKWASEGK
jgi:acetone carboxylase gamma subunit